MHRLQFTSQPPRLAESRATPSSHVQLCSFCALPGLPWRRMGKLSLVWKKLQVAYGKEYTVVA